MRRALRCALVGPLVSPRFAEELVALGDVVVELPVLERAVVLHVSKSAHARGRCAREAGRDEPVPDGTRPFGGGDVGARRAGSGVATSTALSTAGRGRAAGGVACGPGRRTTNREQRDKEGAKALADTEGRAKQRHTRCSQQRARGCTWPDLGKWPGPRNPGACAPTPSRPLLAHPPHVGVYEKQHAQPYLGVIARASRSELVVLHRCRSSLLRVQRRLQ